MHRLLSCILILLLCVNVYADEFSASGSSAGKPYGISPSSYAGLDTILLYDDFRDSRMSVSFNSGDSIKWYTFTSDTSKLISIASSVTTDERRSEISLADSSCGYMAEYSDGTKYCIYAVKYEFPEYDSIVFIDNTDPCSEAVFYPYGKSEALIYYTLDGEKREIERTHYATWNTLKWNGSDKEYEEISDTAYFSGINEVWTVPASYEDTYFKIYGDQYSGYFGKEDSLYSELYEAVAVVTNATDEIDKNNNENELNRVEDASDLNGSAPLTVYFYSNSNSAVDDYKWIIIKPDSSILTYHDEDLTYTFNITGKYTVRHFVMSSVCKDSAEFTVKITESFIDCPNFFTPKSTPGENDEFKVAYKSIKSFNCIILNRLGNKMFQFSDPSKGWDGKYHGKPVSPGVYFYIIKAVGSDGVKYNLSGDINLIE